ncbi:MAG: L-lactate dehydrogenase [Clostridia bacterium]|nr:L-lactate dehydrogenase [Clostridia bacterium]
MEEKRDCLFAPNYKKCGIIGCGAVGSTIAYTLMQTSWLDELVLIDEAGERAEGNAADLSYGLPFHSPMDIFPGEMSDLADCGIIILAAGGSRLQSRTERHKSNLRTIPALASRIAEYNKHAILIVVTNPVELLTSLAKEASGYPASRILGLGTVLDTALLQQLIGRYLGVDSRAVHSFVVGEQGAGEFPVWSSANISGVDLAHFCDACKRVFDRPLLDSLFCQAQDSAKEIAESKGSAAFAVAESVKRIVGAILFDENAILTVSACLEGHYDLSGVSLSLPCIVGRSGIKQILEIPLSDEEETRLHASASYLRGVLSEALLPI